MCRISLHDCETLHQCLTYEQMTGVIVSQVMRLTHTLAPDPTIGFFVVSVPLAAMCHGMALIVCILGLYRFLHWQSEMAHAHAISSGWELLVIFTLSILVIRDLATKSILLTKLIDTALHVCACCHDHSQKSRQIRYSHIARISSQHTHAPTSFPIRPR